ncbi:MAG TPA: hypothetical protein VG962_03830 [Steroidobacteraceae bacterium]|nr:hypothetical protein [Steroidobacteraceae bacterium]
MKFPKLLLGSVLYLTFGIVCVYAQAPSNPGAQSQGEPSGWGSSANNGAAPIQEQMKQLGDYLDTARAFNRKDIKQAPEKDVVIKRAGEILNVLNIPCQIKNAELVGQNTDKGHGKVYQTNTYEIACTNNMGYFVIAKARFKQTTGKLDAPSAAESNAITCFSAEGLRVNDESNGVKSDFYCQLPENGGGDIKKMGETLLAEAGTQCSISKLAWFGVDNKNKIEYDEAACDDGTGYLLQTPLAGGTIKPTAISCVDAAQKGLDCKMTPVIKPPTLETFKDYLAHTDINCKIDNYDQIKVLGKESLKQRYVVEFKCPQQPKGLVAFIPLEGNANKFETVDCVEIKKHGVACKLNTN